MQPQPTVSSPGRLNVILHGTYAFLHVAACGEKRAHIKAFIPSLKHHVYRAGNWLAETELRRADYDLFGVHHGADQLDEASNILVKSYVDKEPTQKLHATVNFPLPLKITSMHVAKLQKRIFSHQEELAVPSEVQHLSSLQVFTYAIKDEADLRLQRQDDEAGHFWEPALSRGFVNLHIFASEDQQGGPPHDVEDLESSLNLLGSQIRVIAPFVTEEIPSDVLPDGVTEKETEDLAPRTRRMARLGRLVLQNGDPNQAWYPNEALDDDPPACGGGGKKVP